MSQKFHFTALIEDAGGGGAYVSVPFDVEKTFGKKRVKVQATIGGEPYRGSLVRMGTACHLLPVLKEIRARIGKTIGDAVEVELEEDTGERVVLIPDDVQAALSANPEAEAFYATLSYTHQKETIRWIEEAKRESTRQGRIERAIERLKQGKRGI